MKRVHKIIILCVVFVLLSATVILKVLYGPQKNIPVDYNDMALSEAYPSLETAGKPSMIVFSYYTECCLTSMYYYGVYNHNAKEIIEDYRENIASIFIDYYALDEENRIVAQHIAQKYEVTTFPTLLLLNEEGRLLEKFIGDMQEEKIRGKLDVMVRTNKKGGN
jgi:thioredoxin-related protein